MSLQELESSNKENGISASTNYQDRARFPAIAKEDLPEVEEVEHVERVTWFVLMLTSCVCLSGFLFGRSSLWAVLVIRRTGLTIWLISIRRFRHWWYVLWPSKRLLYDMSVVMTWTAYLYSNLGCIATYSGWIQLEWHSLWAHCRCNYIWCHLWWSFCWFCKCLAALT